MSTVAQFWEEQFNDDSNNPFDGVKVYHYEAGTTTTKNVWLDRGKTTVAQQPHVGDSHGFVWFYGDGLYRLRITDKNDILLYDWDNVDISPDAVELDVADCEVGMVPVYVGPNSEFECDFVDLSDVRGCLPIANCGTGTDDVPTTGSLLIGNTSGGYTVNRLTAGDGIDITNGNGTIEIAVRLAASPFGSTGQRSLVATDSTFNLVADQVILRRQSTGESIILDSPATKTCNVTTSGPAINARDQSGAFADNSWVHFYWIYDPGDSTASPVRTATLASIASAVAPPTGPTMPTNYTHWSYAGAIRWTGTALVATYILGSNAYYVENQLVFDGGHFGASPSDRNGDFTAAEQTADCATTVPPNALDMFPTSSLFCSSSTVSVVDYTIGFVAGKVNRTYKILVSFHPISVDATLPNVQQRFFWRLSDVKDHYGFRIDMAGYRLPNNGG